MAEEKKEQKEGWGKFARFRAWLNTSIKRVLVKSKYAPFPVHFGPRPRVDLMATYRRLELMLNSQFFKTVRTINETVVKAERDWDGEKGGPSENDNAQSLRNEITSLYSDFNKDEHQINSSLGPFTNLDSLNLEYNCVENGCPMKEETMKINLGASGRGAIDVKFHVPKEVPIRFRRGMKYMDYKVAHFGISGPYWIQLEKDINGICNQVRQALGNTDEVVRRVGDLESKFVAVARHMATVVKEFDTKEIRNHLGGSTGVGGLKGKYQTAKTLRDELIKKKLDENKVYFTHTYKVIKILAPVPSKGIAENRGFVERRKDEKTGQIEDVVYELPRDFKRPEEVGYGLDKHGWSLEVGDGETRSKAYKGGGEPMPLGAVLIDIYEGRTPRMVHPKLLEDCNLLDTAVWVYVSYDAYRDDLRDSRHHANSISVMEHIKAELEPINANRIRMINDLKHRRHQKTQMFLHKTPPPYVTWTIGSSQFNPAFDLSKPKGHTKRGISLHRGRKYYYDTQDNMEQSDEPSISSRGAALYILHKVIEETKYWGNAMSPDKAGVIEVLEAIGKQIKGYDIGPNLDFVWVQKPDGTKEPEAKAWGKDLPINPFKPKR